jgi:hypothetical protein
MGRIKTFYNKEEVTDNIYTKTYPEYFRRIGMIKGYDANLCVPVFIPDAIEEFVSKENIRKEENKKLVQEPALKETLEIQEVQETQDEPEKVPFEELFIENKEDTQESEEQEELEDTKQEELEDTEQE